MTIGDLVDKYAPLKSEGKDLLTIKEIMRKDGLPEDTVVTVARLIANDDVRNKNIKTGNHNGRTLLVAGLFLFLLGIGVTAFTYYSESKTYIVFFGPVFAGPCMMALGADMMRKEKKSK